MEWAPSLTAFGIFLCPTTLNCHIRLLGELAARNVVEGDTEISVFYSLGNALTEVLFFLVKVGFVGKEYLFLQDVVWYGAIDSFFGVVEIFNLKLGETYQKSSLSSSVHDVPIVLASGEPVWENHCSDKSSLCETPSKQVINRQEGRLP